MSSFDWYRDRLLVLVSVRTMRRPKEICFLDRAHVTWDQDGQQRGWPWLHFLKAKNDRLALRGTRFWLPLDTSFSPGMDVAQAFRDWLAWRGDGPGPLLVDTMGWQIQQPHLCSLARRIAGIAGLDGIYTGYSFRITGASLAAAAGLTTAEIQAIGGWKSDAVHCYIRSLGSACAGASRLMGL